MTDILELLGEAAARGVEVTIITNDRTAPPLRLKWQFEDFRDGTVARYRGAGFELYVGDQDGDGSFWTLKRYGKILAEGGDYACRPYYHFENCLLAAEAALFDAVTQRRSELVLP